MTDDALRSLNLMVKAWQADGLHLWTKEEAVLWLVEDQPSYALGVGTTTHAALADDTVRTTISVAAVMGATSILVTSITDIADGDQIGILLDDNTLQWTTVNGAPSGSTVQLDDALDDSVSVGNYVWAYTTALQRPTRVLDVRRRQAQNEIDIPIILLERPDYFAQPNKVTSPSQVTMVYYSPQLVQGILYIWPPPQVITDTIRFTFERPLEDFTALPQTADFPQEWIETLAYNLAYRLARKYSFPINETALLRTDALAMKEKLLGFDREYASVNFQPDFTASGGFPPNGYE